MVIRKEDKVQRGLEYAIIDEVDSVLIDDAKNTSNLFQELLKLIQFFMGLVIF